MPNFLIAINKKDEERWLHLHDRFPVEHEVPEDWFIFTINAYDLPDAVNVAKTKRLLQLTKEVRK